MGSLHEVAAALGAAGANLTIEAPGRPALRVGARPEAARVFFHAEGPLRALRRRDLLAVAEAYLRGEIDVEGDFLEVVKLTEVISPGPTFWERLRFGARLLLRDRRRLQRESIAFHYDRPAEFFLPWFERWRSYSHGLYASSDDLPEEAQERKLAQAVEDLGLEPGMRVFDMGCGWGSFLEYAGLRGIRVHGITLSREQHAFVDRLIRDQGLPCSVERIDFLDYEPAEPFDAAVFMGTFEHFGDYAKAADFLARHLRPGGRLWADFCSEREGHQVGAFLARYIFPGAATYVNVPALLEALIRAGFNVYELSDDTLSYALTCRDWASALEHESKALAERFGEEPVRAFRIFLRASQYFLETNRTQAYHLVAGLEPREQPLAFGG
jgi:cyclopropane-fatty-acyl-phospholipid synthase